MPARTRKLALAVVSAFSLSACQTQISKEDLGTTVGAIAGGVLGYQLSDDNEWVAAAAAIAGGYLGRQIGRYLDEQDRARMAQVTAQTVSTGQAHSWVNPDTNTSGQARVVATETKAKPVKVKVLKKKVKQVPPLDIIGESYRAKSASNVRGGPGTDYEKVGRLSGQDVVNVVGKVKDKDWYLISEDGIGSGFVYSSLMEPAPQEINIAEVVLAPGADVAEYEIAEMQQCRTVEQSVSLADGSTHSERIQACKGATGWETVKA